MQPPPNGAAVTFWRARSHVRQNTVVILFARPDGAHPACWTHQVDALRDLTRLWSGSRVDIREAPRVRLPLMPRGPAHRGPASHEIRTVPTQTPRQESGSEA